MVDQIEVDHKRAVNSLFRPLQAKLRAGDSTGQRKSFGNYVDHRWIEGVHKQHYSRKSHPLIGDETGRADAWFKTDQFLSFRLSLFGKTDQGDLAGSLHRHRQHTLVLQAVT